MINGTNMLDIVVKNGNPMELVCIIFYVIGMYHTMLNKISSVSCDHPVSFIINDQRRLTK